MDNNKSLHLSLLFLSSIPGQFYATTLFFSALCFVGSSFCMLFSFFSRLCLFFLSVQLCNIQISQLCSNIQSAFRRHFPLFSSISPFQACSSSSLFLHWSFYTQLSVKDTSASLSSWAGTLPLLCSAHFHTFILLSHTASQKSDLHTWYKSGRWESIEPTHLYEGTRMFFCQNPTFKTNSLQPVFKMCELPFSPVWPWLSLGGVKINMCSQHLQWKSQSLVYRSNLHHRC